MRYPKGTNVVFNPRWLFRYKPHYAIAGDEVFTVAYVERRDSRRRVLYLATTGRKDWLPVFPSHVRKAKKRRRRKVRALTEIRG